MKKVELLAPVGNMDCLTAAVKAGCDAVYLGGKRFGARSFAGNFSDEELIYAIDYCHLYGVKVYLTINTLIYEEEVEDFVNFVRFAYKNNVDAVIIQDLGMLDLLRNKFPDLELHASTQINAHSMETAKILKQLGVKRVVMARETPIDIIEEIKKKLDIEIEVFVHGALCVSYSGQCLMSSLLGGRSGNRGSCVQSCRKAYDLVDDKGNVLNSDKYLLSTKDLCLLENVDKLIEAGVDSLKIEGRMKRPEYVFMVVSVYRKVIDNYYETGKVLIDEKDIKALKLLFNRNFTNGFMFDEKNESFVNQFRPNHVGVKVGYVLNQNKNFAKIKLSDDVSNGDGLRIIEKNKDTGLVIDKMYVGKTTIKNAKKGDVITVFINDKITPGSIVVKTSDKNQLKDINALIKNIKRKIPVNLNVSIKKDKKVNVIITDGVFSTSYESNIIAEQSLKRPLTKEMVIKQFSKTGDTVYKVNLISIEMDDDLFINIKDLNDIRREAFKEFEDERLKKKEFKEKDYSVKNRQYNENMYSALITNEGQYLLNKDKYVLFYSENKDLVEKYHDVFLRLPRIVNYPKNYKERVLISELGSVSKCCIFDTDVSFNVTNSYAIAFLNRLGARKITLSYELNFNQIKDIINAYEKRYGFKPNVEIILNSYPEVMVSKFNLNKMYNIDKGYLKDKFNNKYKIISNKDFMTIYNFEPIKINDNKKYKELGITNFRDNF